MQSESSHHQATRFDDSAPDDAFLGQSLRSLVGVIVAAQAARQNAVRVDGQIIGTGEADFTKGNKAYQLQIGGKPFQLIDVPGIEGNEALYGRFVDEAVASAHLVVYVNGTNKKPEVATMARMRRYLRRGTTIFPLLNVKTFDDAYEFDEDRISLTENTQAESALKQTVKTFEKEFGKGLLQGGACVHGLIAFSGLAIDPETGKTTIHPDRDGNLGRAQKGYLDAFGDAQALVRFSQIHRVADALAEKSKTFKQDIIESNKQKVLTLVAVSLEDLQKKIDVWERRVEDDQPTFAHCYATIRQVAKSFALGVQKQRQVLWKQCFLDLQMRADAIVEKHFGDADAMKAALDKVYGTLVAGVEREWQAWLAEASQQLDASLVQATQRLAEDLMQTDMQLKLTADIGKADAFDMDDLAMDLSLKDIGGMLFEVGSYALSGALIGSEFPVIGNLVGLLVGASVGLIKAAISFFTGKAERIRAAQRKMHEQIDLASKTKLSALKDIGKGLEKQVTAAIEDAVVSKVKLVEANLASVPVILKKQYAALAAIQRNVEAMPHGSISTIPH